MDRRADGAEIAVAADTNATIGPGRMAVLYNRCTNTLARAKGFARDARVMARRTTSVVAGRQEDFDAI